MEGGGPEAFYSSIHLLHLRSYSYTSKVRQVYITVPAYKHENAHPEVPSGVGGMILAVGSVPRFVLKMPTRKYHLVWTGQYRYIYCGLFRHENAHPEVLSGVGWTICATFSVGNFIQVG